MTYHMLIESKIIKLLICENLCNLWLKKVRIGNEKCKKNKSSLKNVHCLQPTI